MFRGLKIAFAIESERRYRTAIEAWLDILRELHIDRGTLLGSQEYNEMSGVEQCDALEEIDSRIQKSRERISYYEERRNRECGLYRKRVSKMSDDELEVGSDE